MVKERDKRRRLDLVKQASPIEKNLYLGFGPSGLFKIEANRVGAGEAVVTY
jgi:hypothetical protein